MSPTQGLEKPGGVAGAREAMGKVLQQGLARVQDKAGKVETGQVEGV